LLKGVGPIEVNGERYFKVFEIQQAGSQGFVKVPEGPIEVSIAFVN
jgi:hypothetical protein